jgi:Fe-S-cluster containining protein
MTNYKLETDLLKINHLASIRADENYRFRRFLKGKESDKIDRIVHRLHDEISGKIDCTLCGNCCNLLNPTLEKEEIEVLARLENITPESYLEKYCVEVEDSEISFAEKPCRYLESKKCSIYEHRPEQCRLFPYTREKEFIFRLFLMIENYEICPIVFNIIERLKNELMFRRGF